MTQQLTNENNWSLVRTQDNEFIIGNVTQLGDTGLLMSPAFFVLSSLPNKIDIVSLANTGTTINPKELQFSEPVFGIMVANFKWMIQMSPAAIHEINKALLD